MNVNEYANICGVGKSTVLGWIKSDIIEAKLLNEKDNDYFIADGMWPPYTEARAKNPKAIYTSMVKAAKVQKAVSPKIYKISDEQFELMINQLEYKNLIIVKRHAGGVLHCYITPDGLNFLSVSKKSIEFFKFALPILVELISKGITA